MTLPYLEVVFAEDRTVTLFAGCSRFLWESPPVFARPATSFSLLVQRKGGKRKHLKTHLASSQSGRSTTRGLATTRLAAQTVPPVPAVNTPAAEGPTRLRMITALPCGGVWAASTWSVCRASRGNCLSREASCSQGTAVLERPSCQRSVKWVVRCFLCLLSLHQQRKKVAGRANSGGLSQRKREHPANSVTVETLKWPGRCPP